MPPIRFAGLKLTFLQDRHGTNGSVDMFTTEAQPKAGMPIPHYHETWDETVYGLSGTIAWRIGAQDVVVGPGESAFIPRGIVHAFGNQSGSVATFLSILMPGVLGPEYFQETAELVNSGRAQPEAMRSLMLKYGLIPVEQPSDEREATLRSRLCKPASSLSPRFLKRLELHLPV